MSDSGAIPFPTVYTKPCLPCPHQHIHSRCICRFKRCKIAEFLARITPIPNPSKTIYKIFSCLITFSILIFSEEMPQTDKRIWNHRFHRFLKYFVKPSNENQNINCHLIHYMVLLFATFPTPYKHYLTGIFPRIVGKPMLERL